MISTRLVSGMPVVHVFSETDPGNGFTPIEAGLEDVYFHRLGALPAEPDPARRTTGRSRAACFSRHRGIRVFWTVFRFELDYHSAASTYLFFATLFC